MPLMTPEKFWTRVQRCTHGLWCDLCCWEWQGTRCLDYGTFVENGKDKRAHRYAFILAYGAIPPKHFICHHCDNPPCCNPAHLFSGTQADNLQDAKKKGRTTYGERNAQSKLTTAQVEAVLLAAQQGERAYMIAQRMQLSPTTVYHIIHRRRWQHLPGDDVMPQLLTTLDCVRCGHHWITRTPSRPTRCPRCKNPRWWEARQRRPRRDRKAQSWHVA
jgi:predicted Zn-ribbon and HTH transcriptional regulator